MVARACNPSMLEEEKGGSWDPGQLGLHSETLTQNKPPKQKYL
jgi:hypothetical protein